MSRILQITPVLTDAFIRVEDQGGTTFNSLSQNGDRVFLSYLQTEVPPRSPIIGELFANNNGKLTSLGTIPANPDFPQSESAAASPDFNTFIIAVSNANDAGQIQVYNSDLSLRGIIPLPNYIGAAVTLLVGTFTPDSSLFSVTYAVSAPPGGMVTANFDVYNAQTLQLVARTQFSGASNGPVAFNLQGKTYFAVGQVGFLSDFSAFVQPYTLVIYQLIGSSLNIIQSVPQPQFPRSVDVSVISKKKALIGVLTRLVTSPDQPSLFVNAADFTTAIPGDTKGLRIYTFDGSSTNLIVAKDTYRDSNGLNWVSGTNVLFVNLRTTSGGVPASVSAYQVVGNTSKANLVNVDFDLVAGAFSFFPVTSKNGKWLLLSSDDSIPNFKNINLYRLDSKCIKHNPLE